MTLTLPQQASHYISFTRDWISYFTEGQCWALALELHRLDPRLAVYVVAESTRAVGRQVSPNGEWRHVFVRTPGQRRRPYLDIEGLHRGPELVSKYVWGASTTRPRGLLYRVDAKDLYEECVGGFGEDDAKDSLSEARRVAPLVAALYL